MRENRIANLALALSLVISVAIVPAADASRQAGQVALRRPSPGIVPGEGSQPLRRVESPEEFEVPGKPFGGGEFHFLPHEAPESNDRAPLLRGDWC